MSFLRYYDEAVINYFKIINYQDAVEGSSSIPQITFAIPSRKGVKLNIHPEKFNAYSTFNINNTSKFISY